MPTVGETFLASEKGNAAELNLKRPIERLARDVETGLRCGTSRIIAPTFFRSELTKKLNYDMLRRNNHERRETIYDSDTRLDQETFYDFCEWALYAR